MRDTRSLLEEDFFLDMPEEKREFLSLATRVKLSKGEHAYYEGDAADSCWYVESGVVRLFRVAVPGKETVFFLRRPGEVFGLSELMDKAARSSHAQAIQHSVAHRMQRRDFEALLARRPAMVRRAIQVMGRQVRYLCERVESLAVSDIASRILGLFLYLAWGELDESGGLDRPTPVTTTLTQYQIAALTGSCQQTVSEVLHKLQDEGVLKLEKRKVTILDPAKALKRIELDRRRPEPAQERKAEPAPVA